MTPGTGIVHEIFMVHGLIPIRSWSVCFLKRRCSALTVVTDRTSEFFKGMQPCIWMSPERLRRILEPRVVYTQMTCLATVRTVKGLNPPLSNTKLKIHSLAASLLDQERLKLPLILEVRTVVVFPYLPDK